MPLLKPFLKGTNTNSWFCLLGPVGRDLSRVVARAGITTGAILPGPSFCSWFLERKLGERYMETFY